MGNTFAVSVAITPVQDFIKEARKTQDMYCGSILLSAMSQAMLRKLSTCNGAEIIYPVNVSGPTPMAQELLVTNEMLALVHDASEDDAARYAQESCQAGLKYFSDVANKVKGSLQQEKIFTASELSGWDEQIQAQFHSAWAIQKVEEPDNHQSLATDIGKVKALLGSAKKSYLFAGYLGSCVPKCTVCAQWESMGSKDFWHKEFSQRTAARGLQYLFEKNERLCAVCLTKRLAPKWGFITTDRLEAFPSTFSIACAEQKRRFLDLLLAADSLLADTEKIRGYCQAVEEFGGYVSGKPVPQSLPHHEKILVKISARLQQCCRQEASLFPNLSDNRYTVIKKFLELDGQWLEKPLTLLASFGEFKENPEFQEKYQKLAEAFEGLQSIGGKSTRLGMTPPLAFLLVDVDKLGETEFQLLKNQGKERVKELSMMIAALVEQARQSIEQDFLGRVILGGGDELLAFLPLVYAIPAASKITRLVKEKSVELGFPKLTASVAIVSVSPNYPLRQAVEEVYRLLEDTKAHQRPCLWEQDRPEGTCERDAFGVAMIPGSGSICQGIVGMAIHRYDNQLAVCGEWNALEDVMCPLVQSLTLPESGKINVSPKLFRNLLAEFGTAMPATPSFLPHDLLCGGIFQAEFARLAHRHIEVKIEQNVQELWVDPGYRDWVRTITGLDAPPPEPDPKKAIEKVEKMLGDGLGQRIYALALAGKSGKNSSPEDKKIASWQDFSGLLYSILAMSTREVRS